MCTKSINIKAELQQSKYFCTSADVSSHVGEPVADLAQTKASLEGGNTGRNVKNALQAWTRFTRVFPSSALNETVVILNM